MSQESNNSEKKPTGQKYFYYDLQLRLIKLLNLVLLTAAFGVTWYATYAKELFFPFYHLGNIVIIGLFAVVCFLYGRTYDAFVVSLSSVLDKFYSQVLTCLFTDAVMYVVTGLLVRHLPRIIPLGLCLAVQTLIAYLWSRLSFRWYFRAFPAKKTLVIYAGTDDVSPAITAAGLANKFDLQQSLPLQVISSNLTQIQEYELVFLSHVEGQERDQIIKYCVNQNIRVYLLPSVGDIMLRGAENLHLLHLPILHLGRYSPKIEYLVIKRAFDILVAGLALIITLPVFLLVALAIKLTDHGPVFYRQIRLTKDGREFAVLKFRSMRVDAEKDGVARLSTGETDQRVTPVGKVLRRFRLDELPQLLNILTGEMSVVGPRPERPEIAQEYERALPEFSLRLQAKAGLTGYAQVYGKYNTTPANKLKMDLIYLANPSIFEDLKIIFATVKVLFKKDSTEGVSESHDNDQKLG